MERDFLFVILTVCNKFRIFDNFDAHKKSKLSEEANTVIIKNALHYTNSARQTTSIFHGNTGPYYIAINLFWGGGRKATCTGAHERGWSWSGVSPV